GVTAFFAPDRMIYEAHGGSMELYFVSAAGPSAIEGRDPVAAKANFLIGREEQWHLGGPVYSGLAYRSLYPGIDLEFSGNGRHLKSEFVVAPGADPARIRLKYTGAESLRVEDDGSLAIRFGRRVLRENAPDIYQVRNGVRERVDGAFQISGDILGFSIGAY